MGNLRGFTFWSFAFLYLLAIKYTQVHGADNYSKTEENFKHLEEKFANLFVEKNPQLRFSDFFMPDAVLLRPEYPILKGDDLKKYLQFRLQQDIGRTELAGSKFDKFGEDVAIHVLYFKEYREDGSERVNGKMLLVWMKDPTDSLWKVKYFAWNRNNTPAP